MLLRAVAMLLLSAALAFEAGASPWLLQSPVAAEEKEAGPGAARRLPRIDPSTEADNFYIGYKDRRMLESIYVNSPTKFLVEDPIDSIVANKISNRELGEWIEAFFVSTDKRVEEVNRLIGVAEDAARRCDRPAYDAAIRQLITAYVRVSLYIQRTLDQFESLAEAAAGFEGGVSRGPLHLEASRDLRRGWVAFWQLVIYYKRTLTFEPLDQLAVSNEVQYRASTEHRARALADGYMAVYGRLLQRVEEILANADYPPYPADCDEPVDMDMTFLDLTEGEAELEAAREALREFEREAAEYEANARRIRDEISGMAAGGPVAGTDAADIAPPALPPDEAAQAAPRSLPPAPIESDAVFWTPPDMDGIVANIPKSGLPQIEAPADGPVAEMRAGPCGLDAGRVCSVLLSEFRAECGRELKAFLSICRKGPSVSECAERCELNWQQGTHDLALAALAQKQIGQFAAEAEGGSRERAFDDAEAELAANRQLIDEVRKRGEERVVTIFINETSGAVIRHYGKPFEPYPPLRLAGTEPVGLHLNEKLMIEDIEARNRFLEEEMERLVEGLHAENDWARMAMSKWRADPAVPDGRCTPQQNDENRAACLAACRGGAPAGTVNMCHGSFVPQLALPYGRPLLYPPNHPMHDPASAAR